MSDAPVPVPRRRVDLLAARVRWLDRYRRVVSLGSAAVVAPIMMSRVADSLGAEWPPLHATLLAVMFGVIAWWLIEVCLVYVTALWETEHERLLRERGLPRAVAVSAGLCAVAFRALRRRDPAQRCSASRADRR
jgi:hypothetical protein